MHQGRRAGRRRRRTVRAPAPRGAPRTRRRSDAARRRDRVGTRSRLTAGPGRAGAGPPWAKSASWRSCSARTPGADAGQPVRPAALDRREGFDQPSFLEARQRSVERPGTQRPSRPGLDVGHDRVAVLRAVAEADEDEQGRLGEAAELRDLGFHDAPEVPRAAISSDDRYAGGPCQPANHARRVDRLPHSSGLHEGAGDPRAAATVSEVGDLVVRVGVHDERAAVGVEQGGRPARDRDPVRRAIEMADPGLVDHEVGQVPRMGAGRVLQPMLATVRVVGGPAAANVGPQAPTAWMWIPWRPAGKPATWTSTWTRPVASSTRRIVPTVAPVLSTMVAPACRAGAPMTVAVVATATRTAAPANSANRMDQRMITLASLSPIAIPIGVISSHDIRSCGGLSSDSGRPGSGSRAGRQGAEQDEAGGTPG